MSCNLTPCLSPRHRVLLIFFVGALCCAATGAQYSLSAWSPQLKAELNCSQSDIEQIGEVGNLGAYLGPLSGVIVYALAEQWAAFVCLSFIVAGLVPMALAVQSHTGAMASLRGPATLGAFFALGGFGAGTLYTLALTTNISNAPLHRRGAATAVCATLFGLSAFVYTLLYSRALDSDVGSFLLAMALILASVSFLAIVFIRRVDLESWWVVPAGATPLLDLDDEERSSGGGGLSARAGINVPAESVYNNHLHPSADSDAQATEDAEEALEDARSALLFAQGDAQARTQARTCGGGLVGQVVGSLRYLLTQPSYWVMTSVFYLIAGSGLMMINNTGHIVQALNGGVQDKDLTTLLILVLSIANGSGRLLMGLSDVFAVRKGVWLLGVCVTMALANFANAFLFVHKDTIVFGVIFVALAYGALFSIVPILVGDSWGVSSFAMNFGWVSFVSGMGSLTMNHFAGRFYDQHTLPGSNACVGSICYRDAFLLCAGASSLAAVLALFIVPRTQRGKRKPKRVAVAKDTPMNIPSDSWRQTAG